ncbi:chemotaxis protein CheD [Thioclava nitratireducens]|uniref:chemotaxis protein CheD n=1 Tax=Thioclava nitratireducens TaxID=1915078 RepID=UPI00247FCE86|nr:chemotaxis protein CheD [Thioclava nitratireducens]WGT50232.1 chemotaxis protein CheD [Thioclava nitratireducens]
MSAVASDRPIHISQGEFLVAGAGAQSITTILGSCVACCLYDGKARVGGMNHFLLPDTTGSTFQAASFGVNAMELLINELIKLGAQRGDLCAKLFGGARMVNGLSDIGLKNSKFSIEFLAKEGIPCVSQSLGGTQARRIVFWPDTGRARQKLLGDAEVLEREIAPAPSLDIELF